jgi:hypothetical protein
MPETDRGETSGDYFNSLPAVMLTARSMPTAGDGDGAAGNVTEMNDGFDVPGSCPMSNAPRQTPAR